ncbi:hypothetical protein UFOVP844_59 [uncultured Caudovirales phage]|uniref:Large polyvalent protein associated domain-containing protein n=1 Tax=uncultured Caudovirales phage TaxID=2100421 RepID=A0A6J5PCK9_9CAUD|nr:hypothetical protein UFOVP844_59 [uncultured Caudovirales phage]
MTLSPFREASETFYDIAEPIQVEKNPDSKKEYTNDFESVYSPFNIASQIYEGKTTEDGYNEAVRDVTRTGSRMVETILGLPGDLHQFGKKLREKVPSQLNLPGINLVQKGIDKALDYLPTQESLQKRSADLTGGFTTPQGQGEEFSDEIFKTFSGMITAPENPSNYSRLPTSARNAVSLLRKLGTATAAEYGKEGAKKLGAGGFGQEAAKQGLLFALSMGLPRLTGERAPDNFINNIYQRRDNLIPTGTMVTPTGLEARLRSFSQNTLNYGGPTPEKTLVSNTLDQFINRLTGRAIEMEELLQMGRDINRNRAAAMAAPIDKAGVRQARNYWGEISNIFNESTENYLAPISREALDLHRDAQSAYSTLINSRKASNFIMNKARSVPLQTGVAALFGGGIASNPLLAAKGLAGAGSAAAITKTGEMIYRFIMNPALRHYYEDVMINALRENGPATQRALQKLDKRYSVELKDPKSSVNQEIPGR